MGNPAEETYCYPNKSNIMYFRFSCQLVIPKHSSRYFPGLESQFSGHDHREDNSIPLFTLHEPLSLTSLYSYLRSFTGNSFRPGRCQTAVQNNPSIDQTKAPKWFGWRLIWSFGKSAFTRFRSRPRATAGRKLQGDTAGFVLFKERKLCDEGCQTR